MRIHYWSLMVSDMGLIFKITAPIVWTIASTFTFNVDIALEKVPVEILEKGVKYFQTKL